MSCGLCVDELLDPKEGDGLRRSGAGFCGEHVSQMTQHEYVVEATTPLE